MYRHNKPKEPTQEGPLSYVLFDPHFPQFQQSEEATPLDLSGEDDAEAEVLVMKLSQLTPLS